MSAADSSFLSDMIADVERIRREYADVPIRFHFALDVWQQLLASIPKAEPPTNTLIANALGIPSGIPCFGDHTLGPGEWHPVYRMRAKS